MMRGTWSRRVTAPGKEILGAFGCRRWTNLTSHRHRDTDELRPYPHLSVCRRGASGSMSLQKTSLVTSRRWYDSNSKLSRSQSRYIMTGRLSIRFDHARRAAMSRQGFLLPRRSPFVRHRPHNPPTMRSGSWRTPTKFSVPPASSPSYFETSTFLGTQGPWCASM